MTSSPSKGPGVHDPSAVTTFLFTDIEGSSRLWEREPARMRPALASHDALARTAVADNRGIVVKMIGDGMHAAFDDPLDAVLAAHQLQRSLADPAATNGVALRVRCGLHVGVYERRDNDFFGAVVNRAARIMSAAHGGQVLLSQAVAALVADRLPAGASLRDLGTLRLRDLASPEHVHQLVHADLRRDFPALRSLEATPNNLPQQLTAFVGRERELAEVKASLRHARLLTLLGTGGLGKTRLSLQVAADVLDEYPDGAWFVELAPLRDAERVPQAVASVLGVTEEAGRPVIEALVKFVKDRRLLLILDNCEHLLVACAELAKQLLQSGPEVRILTSSREGLHVTGEKSYPVPALAVPDLRNAITVPALMEFEAVHLFVARAVAAQPAFRVTPDNANAVAGICHHLDGIPLALELAAARVRAMSVETIVARLGDRFRLLRSGDTTVLPRQQTLRASIDWSHDLLAEPERALLRRLAVFAGGWTLEAAEAVGGGGALAAADVFELSNNLVEKSLVELEPGRERYRLLETVRQYAQERLVESGDEAGTRARHLDYYLALADQARAHFYGPDEGAWLLRLDLERENLLSAHAWCDRADSGAEPGLRLVSALKVYLFNRGMLGLAYRITGEALARAGAQDPTPARCSGLFDAGQICYFMGRYDEAVRFLDESLAIARDLGDSKRIARALQPLGSAYLGEGDLDAARRHLDEALALARTHGDKRQIFAAMNALGQLARVEGALDKAGSLYEKVLALAREVGDRESIAVGLLNLAMVDVERGAKQPARARLLDTLQIAAEIGSKPAGQSVLEVSAGLGALSEKWDQAARFFGAAEAQAGYSGIHRDPADEAFLRPRVAAARAALGPETFATAEAAGRGLAYEDAIAEARAWLQAD